ncbi:hypothetical protein LIER_34825 [Lithospermum erythrorhizon]|uniref:Uncharacterized protein n=1 Tax=Lithospermum erythrorhizon TaxID=34254 RepID=A0AAV3S1X6_LITER
MSGGLSARYLASGESRYVVLPKAPRCVYCKAYKFYRETVNFCCSAGAVSLAETVLPEYLVGLLIGRDADSREFHDMIRTHKNHFAL